MNGFDTLISMLVRTGPLTVVKASGKVRSHGAAAPEVKPVTIRLADAATERRILRNPSLGFGEAYMDGRMIVEEGDIADLLDLIGFNTRWDRDNPVRMALWRRRRLGAWLARWNGRRRARRNVAHHYELSDRLYDLFLDADRQYSCAYFRDPDAGLDRAQEDKKAHIAAKLRLQPGQRLLDIGCGWGGLALYLHRVADVDVLGVTLSPKQLRAARERAAAAGVADRVKFQLADYRDVQGRFDRIVSVGMFEHVGPAHYRAFFDRCRELLTPDGLMLLHTIGRADGPAPTDPWLARYIFPGGYVPALSEIAPALERSWLWLVDLEILRFHYAETLRCWYQRTHEAREEIVALYDARFFRMWQFYLAGGISAFRHEGHVVFQLLIARRPGSLPTTRDYMFAAEKKLIDAPRP